MSKEIVYQVKLPVRYESREEFTRIKIFGLKHGLGVEELHRQAVRILLRNPELLERKDKKPAAKV